MGIFRRPPLIHWSLHIWLSMSPKASVRKSMNMKSTTGRAPLAAAPIAMLVNPRSLIGVSRRRSGPYRS